MTRVFKIEGAGSLIRAKREHAGLTQQELADELDCDKGLISKYEHNHIALSSRMIEKIARAVNERPEVLACECLRVAFPALAQPRTKAAQLLSKLISHLEKPK